MKPNIHNLLLLCIISFSIAACDGGSASDRTEIAFTETIDIFRNGSPGLAGEFVGREITGFIVGYTLENTEPITRYIGEFPRVTLPGAGPEFGTCNDGNIHLAGLDVSSEHPIYLSAKIIGDTGAEDVSTDSNCHCDSRIDEIAIGGFAVFVEGVSYPLQLEGFKITGPALCPNVADGHHVAGDREFGGAVDIMGAVVLRVAPGGTTILADVSLSMVESEGRRS